MSIVLPLYNATEFLDECMEGIAVQTHRPLEVVAYDNRSTDGSAERVRRWRPRLEGLGMRLMVVPAGPADAQGCGYARNRCIEAASGAAFQNRKDILHNSPVEGRGGGVCCV